MKYLLALTLLLSTAAGQVTPKGLQSDNYTTANKKGGVVLSGDMVDGIMYPGTKLFYGTDGSATIVTKRFAQARTLLASSGAEHQVGGGGRGSRCNCGTPVIMHTSPSPKTFTST